MGEGGTEEDGLRARETLAAVRGAGAMVRGWWRAGDGDGCGRAHGETLPWRRPANSSHGYKAWSSMGTEARYSALKRIDNQTRRRNIFEIGPKHPPNGPSNPPA